jgi:hypothetical protein
MPKVVTEAEVIPKEDTEEEVMVTEGVVTMREGESMLRVEGATENVEGAIATTVGEMEREEGVGDRCGKMEL